MFADAMGRPLPSLPAHTFLPAPPSTVTCKSYWFLIFSILPHFVGERFQVGNKFIICILFFQPGVLQGLM